MMPLIDRMAWRKGNIQRAGSIVSPLRGLVSQGGPLVARLSRVRETEGYILFPLFCPQIERPQPEPSVFQLRLVQEWDKSLHLWILFSVLFYLVMKREGVSLTHHVHLPLWWEACSLNTLLNELSPLRSSVQSKSQHNPLRHIIALCYYLKKEKANKIPTPNFPLPLCSALNDFISSLKSFHETLNWQESLMGKRTQMGLLMKGQ